MVATLFPPATAHRARPMPAASSHCIDRLCAASTSVRITFFTCLGSFLCSFRRIARSIHFCALSMPCGCMANAISRTCFPCLSLPSTECLLGPNLAIRAILLFATNFNHASELLRYKS
ncbi:hypothetical protein TRVL_04550 [Trypanosoma vivax]|nr:hypothetical protein TRVL_04550 [Trypanosoma vivax]